jgi:hypothetical protein
VRLPGRPEVGFNAEVYSEGSCLEPGTTSFLQVRRLLYLWDSEHSRIETPSAVFTAGRHRKLNVMYSDDCHSNDVTVVFADPI